MARGLARVWPVVQASRTPNHAFKTSKRGLFNGQPSLPQEQGALRGALLERERPPLELSP